MITTCPIPESYWLLDGQLLAGEYPGAAMRDRAADKLHLLLEAGIRSFIDLTETSEPLARYDSLLTELACDQGVECRYRRFAIKDAGVPTAEQMTKILAAIKSELDQGRAVYVHCWGGIGRTGTVAACWLVEQGLAADDALARVQMLRWGKHEQWLRSPETDEQCDFVRGWQKT
jgi:Inositol hexakisphosphate